MEIQPNFLEDYCIPPAYFRCTRSRDLFNSRLPLAYCIREKLVKDQSTDFFNVLWLALLAKEPPKTSQSAGVNIMASVVVKDRSINNVSRNDQKLRSSVGRHFLFVRPLCMLTTKIPMN